MAKLAAKLLIVASALRGRRPRSNWYPGVAIFSTLVTIGLIALYMSRRFTAG